MFALEVEERDPLLASVCHPQRVCQEPECRGAKELARSLALPSDASSRVAGGVEDPNAALSAMEQVDEPVGSHLQVGHLGQGCFTIQAADAQGRGAQCPDLYLVGDSAGLVAASNARQSRDGAGPEGPCFFEAHGGAGSGWTVTNYESLRN